MIISINHGANVLALVHFIIVAAWERRNRFHLVAEQQLFKSYSALQVCVWKLAVNTLKRQTQSVWSQQSSFVFELAVNLLRFISLLQDATTMNSLNTETLYRAERSFSARLYVCVNHVGMLAVHLAVALRLSLCQGWDRTQDVSPV